jgi:hypothetical protein
MDAYLDSAHSDAWLLCCALWGTYLVGRPSHRARLAGILVLAAAFWFKQHGAVFLGSALLFLTWREGFRKTMAYWIVAFVAGPLFYVLSQGTLLGENFHFFTWYVPSGWSELSIRTILRLFRFIKANYPVLALASLASLYRALRSRSVGIVEVQVVAAFLTALMGSLDPGSSNNVFIPMGAFFILCGTIELARLQSEVPVWFGLRPGLVAALLAFVTLVHDPRRFWLPASARASYAELQATIRAIPGSVYAPGIGQFVDGPRLYPAAHWIALEDIIRGPRRTASDSILARRMLDPVLHPASAAFVLTNRPLGTMSEPVSELAASYTLVQDWGDRFRSLETLPRPYDSGWPRYLYRFTGTRVADNGH